MKELKPMMVNDTLLFRSIGVNVDVRTSRDGF
jgi:hypothetical protein